MINNVTGNKKFNPLISIVIPVYNGENYVSEAIDSALAQTYRNIEVIVVNDGSKDKTDDICLSYGNKIRYFNKKNGGAASALNFGIKKMKGDYFSWLSHDDLYDKRKVEMEVSQLDENNPLTIVTCAYDFVDENGNFLYSNQIDKKLLSENNALKHLFNYTINGCSLLINKKHFDNAGFFNLNLPTTQDYDMWFRIFRNENVIYVNETLVHSRVHAKQGSKEFLEAHVKECDNLWINFIKSLTLDEKKKLYGNEYNFYDQLLITLKKYVIYPNVFEYLELQKINVIKKDINLRNKFLYDICKISNEKTQNLDCLFRTKTKKRILIGCFGDWSDRGGLNRVVANVSNNISDNFDVFIVTSGKIENGYSLSKNVVLFSTDASFIENNNYEINIFYLIKLFDVDVFINPYNCLFKCIKLMDYLKTKGVKVIAWNHENYFLPYKNKLFYDILPVRNEIFKKMDCVLWLTSASHLIYRKFGENSIVMPNSLTLNNECMSSDFSDDSIISIGRFDDQRKCAESLIILASKLKEAGIRLKIKLYGNYDLDLVGELTNKKLRDLLIEYSLTEDNIEFMGFVENIETIYKHSKINILLSYHEGFGLTIIEAASYGIPTIAYNDSGFEDMIIDGENGFLIERNNFDLLVSTIMKIQDEKTFDCLSTNAKMYVDKFRNENITKKWIQLLNCVINDNVSELLSEQSSEIPNYLMKQYVKEYETLICNLCSNQTDNIKNKDPILRKYYRKIPLKIRKKIKQIIKYKKQ